MLAAYYFVQGVIHYIVFYWGNKLYIHKATRPSSTRAPFIPKLGAERRRLAA